MFPEGGSPQAAAPPLPYIYIEFDLMQNLVVKCRKMSQNGANVHHCHGTIFYVSTTALCATFLVLARALRGPNTEIRE